VQVIPQLVWARDPKFHFLRRGERVPTAFLRAFPDLIVNPGPVAACVRDAILSANARLRRMTGFDAVESNRPGYQVLVLQSDGVFPQFDAQVSRRGNLEVVVFKPFVAQSCGGVFDLLAKHEWGHVAGLWDNDPASQAQTVCHSIMLSFIPSNACNGRLPVNFLDYDLARLVRVYGR
jgi:hypothetical protein